VRYKTNDALWDWDASCQTRRGTSMTVRTCVWLAWGAALVISCSGQENSPAAQPARDPGTEGGPCFVDSTCMDGLVCLSHLCVSLGAAGASGSAGWGANECQSVGDSCTGTSPEVSNCCRPYACRDQRCCAPTASGCTNSNECCSAGDRCNDARCTPQAGGSSGNAGAAGTSFDAGTADAEGGSSCAQFPSQCGDSTQCCPPYTCFQDYCCSSTGDGCKSDSECCMLQDYCDDSKCTPHCSPAGGACDFSIDCCQPMRCDQPNHRCMDADGG
jgi:hypothetical protein